MSASTNTNKLRILQQKFHLVWLSDNIEELKKTNPELFTHLRKLDKSFEAFSETDLFFNYFYEKSHVKFFLIIIGAMGKNTIPIIHDASQLDSVFIICRNKTYHELWSSKWPKVKGVFNRIDQMCQAIEQAVQSPTSTPIVRRALTPEPPQRNTRRERATAMDNQRRDSGQRDYRRRGHSATPLQTGTRSIAGNPLRAGSMKTDWDTSTVVLRKEPNVMEKPVVSDQQRDRGRSRNTNRSNSPLIHSKLQPTLDTPNPQRQLPSDFDELQRTLIATTEQTLRNSLLINNNVRPTTSLDLNSIDRLQDTLVQTIEKHVTDKNDNSDVLNRLFADLKQTLIDTLVQQQQQPVLPHDVIKQTVLDVLTEQQKSGTQPTTTSEPISHRKPITMATTREVKITANLKLTRVDAAFRQERDVVVSNQRLRGLVQQWSSIKSIVDLVTAIKTYGKNNLEYAWLLFCWIGQNIQYQPNCSSNSAESVFRTRQGVCRGFVCLYHECCSLLNIECREISGYAKQAFFKSSEELKQSPHAWNSILLDQYTYLIDATWGAGGRDNDNKLEDFYFLTSPEELIYTHYCNGYQLLEPEISKEDFLSLPVMKSTYYRLGLTLLSPKQGFNEMNNQNLFKITIRAPEHIDLLVSLKVSGTEYPSSLHTLCQRDETKSDIYNCYITPPLDGLYEITIFGKTNSEKNYQDAINMRLRALNIDDAFIFPLIYSTFIEHHCVLIEPLQRLVHKNDEVLLHMIIPHANVVKVQNGDDYMDPCMDEYKKGVLRKKVRVQGDLHICARWDNNADTISIICVFNMI